MNRGTLNSYTLNSRAARGGAVRVAADLLAEAFVLVQARVLRRFNEAVEASAQIGPVVGRKFAKGPINVEVTADILIGSLSFIRDVFAATGQAVVSFVGGVGRREPMAPSGSASVNLIGRVFRKQPAAVTGEAVIVANYKRWLRAPVDFLGETEIVLTARSFTLRFLRAATDFIGEALAVAGFRVAIRQPTGFVGEARVRLAAGVQNDFPYDEDAPSERTFIVAPENNLFYVVS
jgi:hypothetical protein